MEISILLAEFNHIILTKNYKFLIILDKNIYSFYYNDELKYNVQIAQIIRQLIMNIINENEFEIFKFIVRDEDFTIFKFFGLHENFVNRIYCLLWQKNKYDWLELIMNFCYKICVENLKIEFDSQNVEKMESFFDYFMFPQKKIMQIFCSIYNPKKKRSTLLFKKYINLEYFKFQINNIEDLETKSRSIQYMKKIEEIFA